MYTENPASQVHTSHNPWDSGHTGIKLGTKLVIYQSLTNAMKKKDIYVNRRECVMSSFACECAFYKPEYNAKERLHGTAKWCYLSSYHFYSQSYSQ